MERLNKPINEKTYVRFELPTHLQKSFTGKLSGGGQIVVPAEIRNGNETSEEFVLPEGCKVEVQFIAVHYEEKDNGSK